MARPRSSPPSPPTSAATHVSSHRRTADARFSTRWHWSLNFRCSGDAPHTSVTLFPAELIGTQPRGRHRPVALSGASRGGGEDARQVRESCDFVLHAHTGCRDARGRNLGGLRGGAPVAYVVNPVRSRECALLQQHGGTKSDRTNPRKNLQTLQRVMPATATSLPHSLYPRTRISPAAIPSNPKAYFTVRYPPIHSRTH